MKRKFPPIVELYSGVGLNSVLAFRLFRVYVCGDPCSGFFVIVTENERAKY